MKITTDRKEKEWSSKRCDDDVDILDNTEPVMPAPPDSNTFNSQCCY